MDVNKTVTRASVNLTMEHFKENLIRVAEENWLPEHVKMLRALIIAADTNMDYQLAYDAVNEK